MFACRKLLTTINKLHLIICTCHMHLCRRTQVWFIMCYCLTHFRLVMCLAFPTPLGVSIAGHETNILQLELLSESSLINYELVTFRLALFPDRTGDLCYGLVWDQHFSLCGKKGLVWDYVWENYSYLTTYYKLGWQASVVWMYKNVFSFLWCTCTINSGAYQFQNCAFLQCWSHRVLIFMAGVPYHEAKYTAV